MPLGGVKVIDAASHVTEPPDLWSSRMDADKWGEWIPHTDPATGTRYVGGEVRAGAADAITRAAALSGIPAERIAQNIAKVAAGLSRRGGYDPHARLEDMDSAGIDGSVLYPSDALFFGPIDPIKALHTPEFVRDCQRAYNEWVAEFCATSGTASSAWGWCRCRTSAWRWPKPCTPWSSACTA